MHSSVAHIGPTTTSLTHAVRLKRGAKLFHRKKFANEEIFTREIVLLVLVLEFDLVLVGLLAIVPSVVREIVVLVVEIAQEQARVPLKLSLTQFSFSLQLVHGHRTKGGKGGSQARISIVLSQQFW